MPTVRVAELLLVGDNSLVQAGQRDAEDMGSWMLGWVAMVVPDLGQGIAWSGNAVFAGDEVDYTRDLSPACLNTLDRHNVGRCTLKRISKIVMGRAGYRDDRSLVG